MAPPTKYKKEYAEQLVKHMAQGYSYESFAGAIGVHRSVMYDWEKRYPKFAEAKALAFDKCRLTWEGIALKNCIEGSGSATQIIFQLKNRFPKDYRDQKEIVGNPDLPIHTKTEKIVKHDLSKLSEEQLIALEEIQSQLLAEPGGD